MSEHIRVAESWLSDMKILMSDKKDFAAHAKDKIKALEWLIGRVEELEGENNRLKNLVNDTEIEYESLEKSTESAYKELEDLRRGDLNKLGELADVINDLRDDRDRYKQTLETASSEMHHALYSHKSDDVKKFYVENAKRKVDETLEGAE